MGTVGTSAINPHLYKSLAYDPINSLTPIATVASAPVAVVVNPSSGITSLADLIAKAKANPDQYTYGTAGNGAPGAAGAATPPAAGGGTVLVFDEKGEQVQ